MTRRVSTVTSSMHSLKSTTRALREEARQGLRLLVVHVVAVEDAELRKLERLESGERLLEVVPAVAPGDGLAEALVDEDPGTEGRHEPVVPLADGVVAVADPELGDVVQQVLRGVGGVDVGGAGVGAHPKQGEPSGGPELGVERELVIQLGDAVRVGAAARQVDVVAARIEAGAHDLEIGGGQGRVQDDGGAGFTDGAGDRVRDRRHRGRWAETRGSLSRSARREARADTASAMTSCSSIASCTNLRADTVPTAPAPNIRTFTNSSFRVKRDSVWLRPSAAGLASPPPHDRGSQLKEIVSCEEWTLRLVGGCKHARPGRADA